MYHSEKGFYIYINSQKKVIAKKMFGSNLQLAGRKIQIKMTETNGCKGGTAWAALRTAVENIEKIPESLVSVAPRGIEPLLPG